MLEMLLRQAEQVTVALRCDTLERSGASVFAPTRRTALALTELARDNAQTMEFQCLPRSEGVPEELAALERELFSESAAARPGPVRCIALGRGEDPIGRRSWRRRRFCAWSGRRGVPLPGHHCGRPDHGGVGRPAGAGVWTLPIPVFSAGWTTSCKNPCWPCSPPPWRRCPEATSTTMYSAISRPDSPACPQRDRDELENYVLRAGISGASAGPGRRAGTGTREAMARAGPEADRALVTHLDQVRRQVVAPLEGLPRWRPPPAGEWAQAVYGFGGD